MSSHQGNIIEKIIRREGHSLTDLAKSTGVNRRSIYNWFLQPRLKPAIIIKIGQAISHDFSVEFPASFTSADFQTAELPTGVVSEQFNVWKEKYLDLLERYNFLLKQKDQKVALAADSTFNVLFVNDKEKEYKLDLKNYPSALFLQKCRKSGYKVKSINRAAVNREPAYTPMEQRVN